MMKPDDATPPEPEFSVLWPLGRLRTPPSSLAPRPADLSGTRVALVWDHVFRGDDMFDIFREVVSARYPGMSFVDHEVFGNTHGSAAEEHDALEHLGERLREHEIDAAVVGVGA